MDHLVYYRYCLLHDYTYNIMFNTLTLCPKTVDGFPELNDNCIFEQVIYI